MSIDLSCPSAINDPLHVLIAQLTVSGIAIQGSFQDGQLLRTNVTSARVVLAVLPRLQSIVSISALEQLLRLQFQKVRLKELRGVGGGPLELDIYNASLKLAIEHNGWQHYEPQMGWGGKAAFERQEEHDRRRREFCKRKGITTKLE